LYFVGFWEGRCGGCVGGDCSGDGGGEWAVVVMFGGKDASGRKHWGMDEWISVLNV
jgi:hypothetical protein